MLVTPVSTLPNNSDTTGALQVTGNGVRVSIRGLQGRNSLALLRMNSVTGRWYRVGSDQSGNRAEWVVGPSEQGNADVSEEMPVAAGTYYHLLVDGGSAFVGYAELESITISNGSSNGAITGAGGVAVSGVTASLGGTDDMTLSTGALAWSGAVGKTATLTAGDNFAVDSSAVVSVGTTLATQIFVGRTASLTVLAGTTQFSGVVQAQTNAMILADPGAAGTITATGFQNVAFTSVAAEARTLAAPSFVGQTLSMSFHSFGGTVTVTGPVLNAAGNTTMVFDNATDSITLKAMDIGGVLRWRVQSNDGVTLS